MRDQKKKLLLVMFVLVASTLLVAGWIFLERQSALRTSIQR
jgi:hypothetical protein